MELELNNRVQTRIPTRHGEFILHYYSNNIDDKEHIALVKGDVANLQNVPVRMHSECFTGDVLGSRRCDCGEQLDLAQQLIADIGCGILIYLRQEGRGIGLLKKLQAYNLQDLGLDTVDANIKLGHLPDEREYSVAALILKDLRINSVRLITNNPSKIDQLQRLGILVKNRIAIESAYHHDNLDYLKAKANKMSHLLSFSSTQTKPPPKNLKFIQPFLHRLQQQNPQQKPHITLRYTQSINGKISSSPVADDLTHILRKNNDALLVDINYVLANNLKSQEEKPLIILDSELDFSANVNLAPTTKMLIIFTTAQAIAHKKDKAAKLKQQGIHIIAGIKNTLNQIDADALMRALTNLNIKALLVEGDSKIITQFLQKKLGDYCIITIKPTIIKGSKDATPSYGSNLFIKNCQYQKVASDLIVYGSLFSPEEENTL